MMTVDQAKREADLDRKIIKMFRAQLDKETKAEAKEMQNAAKRHDDALKEYNSRDEILDAYGWGLITERQYDRLCRDWDEAHEPKAGRLDFIEYLKREISNTQATLKEMERIIRDGGAAG